MYIKTCDKLEEEVNAGNVVDLTIIRTTSAPSPSQSAPPVIEVSAVQTTDNVGDNDDDNNEPMTILESLQQRLAKYAEEESKAKEAGNESKARRMGRIRKQYEDAIKLHKKG